MITSLFQDWGKPLGLMRFTGPKWFSLVRNIIFLSFRCRNIPPEVTPQTTASFDCMSQSKAILPILEVFEE
jgi:hypothetical protein